MSEIVKVFPISAEMMEQYETIKTAMQEAETAARDARENFCTFRNNLLKKNLPNPIEDDYDYSLDIVKDTAGSHGVISARLHRRRY